MKFKNKVVLVTGGARGIGRAISLGFARNGAKVIINYLSSAKEAKQLVNEIKRLKTEAIAVKADVSIVGEVNNLIKIAVKKFGRIDILVNNAGIQIPYPFEDMTENMWDKTLGINLKGQYFCIQKVLPYMKKQKGGKIINISSIAAYVGSLVSVPYGVSKAGIVNMTKTLSKELGKYNITINSVAPGPTKTDLFNNLDQKIKDKLVSETPLGNIAEPEDIANAVLFFAGPDADFITGQTLIVDGGRI